MKSNIHLILIGITAAILFCTHLGGVRPALAAAPATKNPDHPLKVKHIHDSDDNVIWQIKENGKSAFRLPVKPGKTVGWTSMGNNEPIMSIIVNNTNDWQGTFKVPTYGPGCPTCGQIDTTTNVVQLTFTAATMTTNSYYRIVITNQTRAIPYDYDSVDATIVWDGTLKGK